MEFLSSLGAALLDNWPAWVVTGVLILAAVIDGIYLKVPNWLTFSFIIAGWVYSAAFSSMTWYEGLGWSLFGTFVGLALLWPLYSIGGMGAGDVKLLAGVGAWVYPLATLYAFCASAVVGAVLALLMVWGRGAWEKHSRQLRMIVGEILTIRDPEQLSEIASKRKPSMLLLPYGIPIAIGSILYFAWVGMLP